MTYRRRRRKRRRWKSGCIGVFAAVMAIGVSAVFVVPFAVGKFGERITETFSENAVHVLNTENTVSAVPQSEVGNGYYYKQLDAGDQGIYRQMLYGLRQMESVIRLEAGRDNSPEKIYEYILYDRPELFWCAGSCQMTVYRDYTEFRPAYACSETERQQRQKEIDSAVQECLAGISADASEYEKIRMIYEYLVNSVDYNENASDNQNIYSAFVGKSSVCAGYSRAVQYLLNQLGIECIYVVGTAQNQEAHAWNIVQCEGKYYHVDATFGDPVFLGEESGEKLPENIIYYDYLCCTDQEIMADHTISDDIEYPVCDSEDLNYYRMHDMYYDSYNAGQILEAMNDSIYEGNDLFICKFSSSEIYNNAKRSVIEDLFPKAAQTVGKQYGLDQVKYTYIEDSTHNKIIVFWNYQQ